MVGLRASQASWTLGDAMSINGDLRLVESRLAKVHDSLAGYGGLFTGRADFRGVSAE